MQTYVYQTMRDFEDTYWWYTGLRSRVVAHVSKIINGKSGVQVLDGGCGTGGMMQVLKNKFPEIVIVGIDYSTQALHATRERCISAVGNASVEELPFGAELFDIVISLDVLETRGVDDVKALKEFHRVLKKGGMLLLNLTAFECLRGQHDDAAHVGRRYTKKTLMPLLLQAGFVQQSVTYWNALFFPLLLFWRPVSRLFADTAVPLSDLKPLPRFANKMLTWLIMKELQFSLKVPLPFGSSIFVVAQKSA
jgi:ubiquinone/menaquinone biosynthesis C-methylase UbiE